jgi:hypothetical protein
MEAKVEPQEFTFYATLTDKGQTVGFYDDGRARIVLETDVRQLASIMKIIAYGRKTPIRFTAHIANPSDSKQ